MSDALDFFSIFLGGGSAAGGGGGKRPPPGPTAPASPAESATATQARQTSLKLREDYEKQRAAALTRVDALRTSARNAALERRGADALAMLQQANDEQRRADTLQPKMRGIDAKMRQLDRAQGAVREAEATGLVHMAMDELTEKIDPGRIAELHEDLNEHAHALDEMDEELTTPIGSSPSDLRQTDQDQTAALREQLADLMADELDTLPDTRGAYRPRAPAPLQGSRVAELDGVGGVVPVVVRPQPSRTPSAHDDAARRRALAQRLASTRGSGSPAAPARGTDTFF
jgi:hypothetical protein